MGHVQSKSRSLDQILEKIVHFQSDDHETLSECLLLEKPYVCSRGYIFSPIIMKLDQHVCLDGISHKFENGSCWVKK